jgi:NADH-quinone oxidoreductase subunit C
VRPRLPPRLRRRLLRPKGEPAGATPKVTEKKEETGAGEPANKEAAKATEEKPLPGDAQTTPVRRSRAAKAETGEADAAKPKRTRKPKTPEDKA